MRIACIWAVTIATSFLASTPQAFALRPPGQTLPSEFDVRQQTDNDARPTRIPQAAQQAAEAALRQQVADLVLRWNPSSGSPQWVATLGGHALSAPSAPATPENAARGYLETNAALVGLTRNEVAALELSSVVPAPRGGAHVHFRQTVAGVRVLDSHALVNVEGDGSVRSFSTALYARARIETSPVLRAADAVAVAVRETYPHIVFDPTVTENAGERKDRLTVFDRGGFGDEPSARLVLFPEPTSMRLAWDVRISEPDRFTSYQVVVDAADGELLLRRNLTRYATANVLASQEPVSFTEEVAPDNWQAVSIPDAASPTGESPAGWIDGAGTVLLGNNAVSRVGYVRNPSASEPSGDYGYAFNSTRSATVHAWWLTNEAHDHFRSLGFDEAHGNFQSDNFGLGGIGGDPMDVIVFGLGGRNNAFFGGGGVDGELPSITFFWSDCDDCGDHDGYPETGGDRHAAYGGDAVFHEYMHGVSSRLIGGPATFCQFGLQASSMDEGWSDYFSASYYDDPNTADYFVGRRGFLRSALNDMDYRDLCKVGNVCGHHDNGMIWQAAVWDLREAFIALDPAGGAADVDRLLLESLSASACLPSYVDARDAILDADQSLFGGAHRAIIWNVFAARGLGLNAFSFGTEDSSPTANFTVPLQQQCTAPATVTSLSATADGANVVRLDYAATGASAVEIRREDLDNPLDRMRTVGYTTSTTSYSDDTVLGGRSYRYQVVPLGAAGPPCAGGASPTADATATGSCSGFPVFDPQPVVTDNQDCSVTISWQAAAPLCAGEPVVYSVYRAAATGFEPSARTLIGRTTSTSLVDTPPDDGRTRYYLVLAEHGLETDPADHRERGTHQALRWAPAIPVTSRTTVQAWDFDAGPQGWSTDNAADPTGGWVLVAPSPASYGGGPFAPDEAAGGSGMAWVTGDAPGSRINEADSDGEALLISPQFDGGGGATLLSFDFWSHDGHEFQVDDPGLRLIVDNGSASESVRLVSGMTVQEFETDGRRSWQRGAIDLATLVAPTSTMQVTFVPRSATSLTEFGIDNVRIESGQACARSALSVRTVSVDDSNAGGGNGNGVLDPGETAFLELEIGNDGPVTAFAPVATLTSGSALLRVHDSVATFPDVGGGGGTATATGLSVTLSPEATCEETAVLDLEIVDAAGTRARERADLEFGFVTTQSIFSDDFETDKGWILVGDPGPGAGQWQRGDPVGTFDGGVPANPEDDSPNDAGSFCYVTENGPVGGGADDNDLDASFSRLFSPKLDFSGFKRARMRADVWFYNDTDAADPFEDYAQLVYDIDDGEFAAGAGGVIDYLGLSTPGWQTFERLLEVPMVDQIRLGISVNDQGPLEGPLYTDSTVEAGIDNVLVEVDAVTCDPTGVLDPPNGIGDTLRVDRGIDDVVRSWTVPPTDPAHDGAAYYRVFVSAAADAGFAEELSTATTSSARDLATTSATEFYLVSAFNEAGDSGDAPAP